MGFILLSWQKHEIKIENGRGNSKREILCDDTGLSKGICLCAGVCVFVLQDPGFACV